MIENEWIEAQKPFTCKAIAKEFGTARKLRLLMVGFLEPLQDIFSEGARRVFLMLREWAEDDRRSIDGTAWSAPGGPLADYMEWSTKGLASHAVSWIVHYGSQIEPKWTYSLAMPAAELCDKAAQALVLKKVGSSPQGIFLSDPRHKAWSNAWNAELQALHGQQAELMRCVYGNPFQPATLDHSWLTPKIVGLAQRIYDDRAFDRMSSLGDALEGAGCRNAEILNHCRALGPHVRGCWVLDLVLGKE